MPGPSCSGRRPSAGPSSCSPFTTTSSDPTRTDSIPNELASPGTHKCGSGPSVVERTDTLARPLEVAPTAPTSPTSLTSTRTSCMPSGSNRCCRPSTSRTPEVKAAYLAPHPKWSTRTPILVFPREIPRGPEGPVSQLLGDIESGVQQHFRHKPVHIAWGMKDPLLHFRDTRHELARYPPKCRGDQGRGRRPLHPRRRLRNRCPQAARVPAAVRFLHGQLLGFSGDLHRPGRSAARQAARYRVAAIAGSGVGSRYQVVRVPLPLTSMGPRSVVSKSSLISR